MSLINARLPDDVERGARGGPRFKTTVVQFYSGHEKRNIDWSRVRCEWDISYGIQDIQDLQDVIGFFYAARGRAHSFLFKDWSDYTIGSSTALATFATGDGSTTQFQLVKRYSANGQSPYERPIKYPVNGTVQITVDDVVAAPIINYTTGIVTFSPAPANNTNIKVYCEYNVPVRFDHDELDISVELFNVGSIPSIKIIEVRDE